MGLKVSILLANELARRFKRSLTEAAQRHGHVVVPRREAELVVTDRPLVSSAWLTVNVAADGDDEVARAVARVEVLFGQLARAERASTERPRTGALKLAHGEVDLANGTFLRTATSVETKLTATELSLLERLHAARGSFVSRRTLEREVWGYAETTQSRTVLSTIHRLRQKIELDPANPTLILSDRQRGYRLVWEDGQARRPGRELFGRDALLTGLVRRLDTPGAAQIAALTGPEGVGKTVLGQALATRLGRRAVWCDCGGVRTASELAVALARALDCRVDMSSPALVFLILGHALAARDGVVLFLDDLDLETPALRDLLEAIAEQAKRAHFVVTCRAVSSPFRLAAVAVPLLEPEGARAMLTARLSHLESKDAVSDDELEALLERCEGLPLALELAAREHLRAPSTAHGAVGKRWVDSTWESVSDEARYLLGALAALPGGFYFDAVEALTPRPERAFSLFTELVRRSLIVHEGPERYARSEVAHDARESRFRVLDHVRALALSREEDAVRAAAGWLSKRAARWARDLGEDGDAFGEAMRGFIADELNLSFAARWAIERAPEVAETLVTALGEYLVMRGPLSEALELTRATRARRDTPKLALLEAKVLTFMSQDAPAIALLRGLAGSDAAGSRFERARVFDSLASLLPPGEEHDHCRERAAALFGESPLGEAETLETVAAMSWAMGDLDDALAATEQALTLFEREGVWRRATALRINRGSHLRDLGRLAEAREVLEAARADAERRAYGMAERYADLNLALLVADEALAAPGAGPDKMEEARRIFSGLALASRRHGKLGLAARANVWRALCSNDALGQRAELEVALRFALEVDDGDASATAAGSLHRDGRTAAPGEPTFEALCARLPPVTRRPCLRLAGRLGPDEEACGWPTTLWRLAGRFGRRG